MNARQRRRCRRSYASAVYQAVMRGEPPAMADILSLAPLPALRVRWAPLRTVREPEVV